MNLVITNANRNYISTHYKLVVTMQLINFKNYRIKAVYFYFTLIPWKEASSDIKQ